ncbi:DUF397 domain-containing protein [Streptomyces sp. NPDC001339]|uniref:DUF397 domain-containing protein n=1 Tax=Streptomyces sp. NPDC001339 TaxID=3364563 RepID=UPI0036C4B616
MNEAAPFRWHKSSYSGETNGCLEIRTPPPNAERHAYVTRRIYPKQSSSALFSPGQSLSVQ